MQRQFVQKPIGNLSTLFTKTQAEYNGTRGWYELCSHEYEGKGSRLGIPPARLIWHQVGRISNSLAFPRPRPTVRNEWADLIESVCFRAAEFAIP